MLVEDSGHHLPESADIENALDLLLKAQLERAFGPELAEHFWAARQPRTLDERLAFIRKCWIGVFKDSPLSTFGLKRLEQLERLCRSKRRGRELSAAEHHQFAEELARLWEQVQRLLPRAAPETSYASSASAGGVHSGDAHTPATLSDAESAHAAPEAMRIEAPATSARSASGCMARVSSDVAAAATNVSLVVLDGENIAWAHGQNAVFSPKGIAIAVDFFRKRGYRCVVFLPDYRRKRADLPTVSASDALVFVPAGEYDDTFALGYAVGHDAILVTNDLLQDHLDQFYPDEGEAREALRKWLGSHRCSFTFVGDEFLPNPHFFLP
jgi:hypothetical protein